MGNYGTEHFKRLRRALLHRPTEAIKLVNTDNYRYFLFDAVPDVDRYLQEHAQYESMLRGFGVDVMLLEHHVRRNIDLMHTLPNLAYLHDIAAISTKGSILSKMSTLGRCHEDLVVHEALDDIGIPELYAAQAGDMFEGCLLLSPTTVFVADTQRHGPTSIERFITAILGAFDEIIYAKIPQARRFMHPDMVLGRMAEHLMVYYPSAFLETYHIHAARRTKIDIKAFMNARGVEMVPITDAEQKRWGSSFVPLEPGVIINYDLSLEEKTVQHLERLGVRFIHFHPNALLAGGGSLRCLTMRIWRT